MDFQRGFRKIKPNWRLWGRLVKQPFFCCLSKQMTWTCLKIHANYVIERIQNAWLGWFKNNLITKPSNKLNIRWNTKDENKALLVCPILKEMFLHLNDNRNVVARVEVWLSIICGGKETSKRSWQHVYIYPRGRRTLCSSEVLRLVCRRIFDPRQTMRNTFGDTLVGIEFKVLRVTLQ